MGDQPEHYLLTPGPLSTCEKVRQAMLKDWGSWDAEFTSMTREIRARLLGIALTSNEEPDAFECIPMQGSGTFVVEAMLGCFVPHDGKVLVLVNGAYGQRIATILEYLKRDYLVLDKGDYLPPRGDEVARVLEADAAITHVVVVHCETSSGILNPVQEISDVVYAHGRNLLVDSMSAFGAVSIDPAVTRYEVLVSSANKCIEGVPGFGFLIARKSELLKSRSRSHSLSLDVYAQWENLEKSGQWRYTPPTHTIAAFNEALKIHEREGGTSARLKKYSANRDSLVAGMRALGFETLLQEPWLSPIIVTFFNPADPAFEFTDFYNRLKASGFIIYPGKLTVVDSFRIGCIGHVDTTVMNGVVAAVRDALAAMGVNSAAPHNRAMLERSRLAG